MARESLIIIGSCDEPMRGLLRILRASDGSTRWERRTGHPLAGAVLALTHDTIVAVSNDHSGADRTIAAWQAPDEAPLWQTTLPERRELPQSRGETRVVTSGDLTVAQLRKYTFALDMRTGAILWEYAGPDRVMFAGLLGIGREHVYVAEILRGEPGPRPQPGPPPSIEQRQPALVRITRALSLLDGTPQWTTEDYYAALPPAVGASSLLAQDGVVYTFGNGLHALDTATGAHIWTTHPAIPTIHGGSLISWRDLLVAVSMLEMGAYEHMTGAPRWRVPAREPATTPGSFSGALVMGDIFYTVHSVGGQQAGYIEGRDLATGAVTMRWPDDPTTLRSDVAWRFHGADGMLYIPGYDGLHAVRVSDGRELWQTRLSCAADALLAVPASR